jgi:hypothetical protein
MGEDFSYGPSNAGGSYAASVGLAANRTSDVFWPS